MNRPDSPHKASTVRIVIVAHRRLECDAFASLLQSHTRYHVICTTVSLKVAAEIVGQQHPDLVMLDAAVIDEQSELTFDRITELFGRIPILVLDDDIRNGRLAAILNSPCAGYFTRRVRFDELARGIELLLRGECAFGPSVMERIHHTSRGWELRQNDHIPPIASLTPREIEVLKLVALGHSIKHCAEKLALAPSTVDNHKARLMKKLGVHKSLDLTRLAIREGLVGV